MSCCHHYLPIEGGDNAFSVDSTAITFGRGCLAELGAQAQKLDLQRVALVTDSMLRATPHFAVAHDALIAAGIDVEVFSEVAVEPTNRSFQAATVFAQEFKPDGYVSLGGGSVIDTAKAANLYATWPAEFDTYVNAPVGAGAPIPGALKPHIACPTTSGTGSECTGIAVFDYLELETKTGIASAELKPTRALIDPNVTATLPGPVVAASAFDVLSHALESYTARPYTARPAPTSLGERPLSQGANPWSDMGCRESLRLLGEYMERAVADANDGEAREQVMWAATLAGIAFGNSGVHLPHGMAYSVAGLVKSFQPDGYPDDHPMVPHGMSVIVNAPSVFHTTAPLAPQRHFEAAEWLGADTRGAVVEDDAAELIATELQRLMRATGMPNGLAGVGYGDDDVEALTRGASMQKRLLDNAPIATNEHVLTELYQNAMRYW